jgi:hypothetical protein
VTGCTHGTSTEHPRNISARSGVLIGVEVDETPRPLGLVIVAVIAALLWSLVAPNLGTDRDEPSSPDPSAAAAVATPV